MSAEIGLEEVWLEVICLTNLEIAGSPRNISRYSLKIAYGGRALDGLGRRKLLLPIKLQIP